MNPILILFRKNLDNTSHFRQLAKFHRIFANIPPGLSPLANVLLAKVLLAKIRPPVSEMKHSKDPETGLYLFDLSKLAKVNTVRSFFSRQKASENIVSNPKPTTFKDNGLLIDEQYDSEEDIEEEALQEQVAIDLELRLADIRSTVNKDDITENNLATATSKRALSSLKNENLSHSRKSPRFSQKNGAIKTFFLQKMKITKRRSSRLWA